MYPFINLKTILCILYNSYYQNSVSSHPNSKFPNPPQGPVGNSNLLKETYRIARLRQKLKPKQHKKLKV